MTDKRPNKSKPEGDQKSDSSKPEGTPPRQPTPMSRGLFIWIMLIAMCSILFFMVRGQQQSQPVTWGEFSEMYTAGQLEPGTIVMGDTYIEAQTSEDAKITRGRIRLTISPGAHDTWTTKIDDLTAGNFKTKQASPWALLLVNFLPWLLFIAVIWFFLFRSIRNAGGGGGMFGNFGRSRHRVTTKEHTSIDFKDVAGVDEAKEELTEIVEFLRAPKKFQRLGGRIPRGVLLSGLPGCGKTLLAKAIAGEADVPFFSISGSDFVEMFVGVGASRVRDLFKQAKENSPCIIFLDEIDAVGRKRGSGFSGGGNDEREQTLNAILVEMDGFETSDQVIVIAATNRADVLDPALTRPGRFDRQVSVPLPDVKGRAEILKVHASKIKMSPTIDLERMARGTPMFSGADLAAIINESAIIATMAGKDFVEQDDLEEARDKIKFGRARKSRVVEEKERIATAYHEAGHAVTQALLSDADPLHKVTIIPRGMYGGATFSLPENDRYGFGLKYLTATMRVLCAGRIAEQRETGDISSGASMDIKQVTSFARMMVVEWGMSDRLGFVRYGQDDSGEYVISSREYSDETARVIDEEVRRYSDEAFADCERIVEENWEKIDAVAQGLLKHETLTADEVHRLMRGEKLDKSTVSDLLDAERRKNADTKPIDAKSSAATDDRADEEPDSGVMPSPA